MADLAHAALAALPVLAVFGLIATRRVAAWRAALAGAAVAILLATIAFGLPAAGALSAAAYGIATGLFPILYIIAGSLLLYHLTVVTGRAERLREALAHLAADRYLLLLVVGFCFAGFLDATAGFLTPVTVCTALLVNLGVPAVEAAAYTLVASSLPPIFGAMGIPVLVLAESAAVPLPALARAQAAVAAALSVAFPAWLTLSFGGRAALRRVWAPSLAAGAAYAVALWWMVSRVSLTPAALAASLAALAATAAAASLAARSSAPVAGRWRGARAWWPWGVLMGTVLVWSLPPVARALARFTLVLPMPALHPAPSWRIDLAASPGTAILAAVAICSVAVRASVAQLGAAARATVRQLRLPAASMLAMFALAQVMNASGMTHAIALIAARAGGAFPLVSPFVSGLGTAIAGSNTASNALLGRFQAATAAALGQDPVFAVALAGAAAALGKMVAPQVIAAAVGAAGIAGAEGRLLRIGLAHGLLWTTAVGVAGLLLAR